MNANLSVSKLSKELVDKLKPKLKPASGYAFAPVPKDFPMINPMAICAYIKSQTLDDLNFDTEKALEYLIAQGVPTLTHQQYWRGHISKEDSKGTW